MSDLSYKARPTGLGVPSCQSEIRDEFRSLRNSSALPSSRSAAVLNIAALYTARAADSRRCGDAATWVRHTQDAREPDRAHLPPDRRRRNRAAWISPDAGRRLPSALCRCAGRDTEGSGRAWRVDPGQSGPGRANGDGQKAAGRLGLPKWRRRSRSSAIAATKPCATILKSHEGMVTMSALRLALDGMAAEETDAVRAPDPGSSPTTRT